MTDSRVHAHADTRPRAGGEFVLYWMQITHRAHDNFALNVAVERANELGLPVLVYHALRHDYPYASDRLHTFILEGVADLYDAFEARGLQYAFYLDTRPETTGSRATSPLVQLAERAALVVTDYFPTFIIPRQTKKLREKTATPVIAVDSACVVPMAWHEKEHATALGFRNAMARALPGHLHPVPSPEPDVRRAVALPFEPVRPRHGAIAPLVAQCAIDHTVPPSPLFRGGTAAGRARLLHWLQHGLPIYDQRNDPNVDATSRLSPYLHFGHLSPHEVALAAREAGPAEQSKRFLDELLTWRELSHNFCHFNPRHRTVEGIPAWARQELANHEADPRPALYDDATMEFAQTDDELWNAAQRSYLRDGWMHNYLRMLWGKAVLAWTPDAAATLRLLEHWNNRYSLDGRNPNTYGGIHWCLGKFDRPFFRRPIYGTVRYQSTNAAVRKFDVPRYIRAMRRGFE